MLRLLLPVWILRTDLPDWNFSENLFHLFKLLLTRMSVEMSHLNAFATHRMSLEVEEFPQLAGLSRTQHCDRARSVLRKMRAFSCDKIAEEVDEEGLFTVEEDKAERSFLQSLESLRRCTRGRQ